MKLDVLKWFDSFVKDEAFSESWSPVQKGYVIQSTYCTQTMLNLSINLVGEETRYCYKPHTLVGPCIQTVCEQSKKLMFKENIVVQIMACYRQSLNIHQFKKYTELLTKTCSCYLRNYSTCIIQEKHCVSDTDMFH